MQWRFETGSTGYFQKSATLCGITSAATLDEGMVMGALPFMAEKPSPKMTFIGERGPDAYDRGEIGQHPWQLPGAEDCYQLLNEYTYKCDYSMM